MKKKDSVVALTVAFSLMLIVACICISFSVLFVTVRNESRSSDYIVETAVHQALGTAIGEAVQPVETPTGTPITTPTNWRRHILTGEAFQVVFDETYDDFDDANYTGNWRTDPMGTLKGGEAYVVRFSFDGGWIVTGYNQDVGRSITRAYPAASASPLDNQICLWGLICTFNDDGEVFLKDYGLVGHLRRWVR
jgi:hypothetical protein